jgi:DNA-binding MltR family transcriptional regulator
MDGTTTIDENIYDNNQLLSAIEEFLEHQSPAAGQIERAIKDMFQYNIVDDVTNKITSSHDFEHAADQGMDDYLVEALDKYEEQARARLIQELDDLARRITALQPTATP